MSEAFIGAVKETRTEALEHFVNSGAAGKAGDPGHDDLVGAAAAAIDKAIGGVLDNVEEHYQEIVTYEQSTVDDELEQVVSLNIVSGLSGLYFDEISN